MIALQGVSKSFAGREVLTDVSFRFPDGEVTALRGPSGCGKTTLVSMLLGLLKPDAGEVLVPGEIRTAAVFQEDRLIEHFSAARNVRLTAPAQTTDEEICSALDELGLDGRDTNRVSKYSGGMRRRVAIARAALFKPQLLVLDEPFKGLDEQTRAAAAAFLLRRCNGATIVLVTHDKEEARLMGATAQLELGDAKGRGAR